MSRSTPSTAATSPKCLVTPRNRTAVLVTSAPSPPVRGLTLGNPAAAALGRSRVVASGAVRLGVLILPEHRSTEAASMWARAESMGFDHAWTYDHIAWRTLRDGPWFAVVPTLTAAAGSATSTIRLGTMVASPNFRHPVAFARELITLDDVSDGRLTAGLGAGGEGWDATILGQAPWSASERADHFDEFVRLLDLVLRGPTTTFTGRTSAPTRRRTNPVACSSRGCPSPSPPLVPEACGWPSSTRTSW